MKSIAIFFNARRNQGGLFQYACTLASCLKRYGGSKYKITLFNASDDLPALKREDQNWNIVSLPVIDVRIRQGFEYVLQNLARLGISIKLRVLPEYRQIAEYHPDLMIYVKPCVHAFQWSYHNIMPVHDIQHRLQPQFPEVSAKGEYHRREYLYQNALPKVNAILTDSEIGKEDVLACYEVDPGKIYPIPYIASTVSYESESGDFDLVPGYLFYPAAFWKHKNHSKLIEALAILRLYGRKLHLVLAGSQNREYSHIQLKIKKMGLEEQVTFLGYVKDEVMPELYKNALALVMPTYFGPTNIPVLEAWQYGCPVITSDIRGIREQISDAGILVDPNSPDSIATGIMRVAEDEILRRHIIEAGRKRISNWGEKEFAAVLLNVISDVLGCPS